MKLAQDVLLTAEGWQRLREELVSLKEQRRSKMSEHVERNGAAEFGEASVNYVQSGIHLLDQRIAQLEEVLSRAIPVGDADQEDGVVGVGSRVAVRWEDGEEESYVVVGPPEVDPRAGRISYESPVGRALLGRKAGEWVEALTPTGPRCLQVVALS